MEDLEETRKVRGLNDESLLAISGLVASGPTVYNRFPVYDVMVPEQLGALVELILDRTGRPEPAGQPGGPLAEGGDWRPGIHPPGVFPEVPDRSGHGGHT
jgi:hypothetical protein